MNREQRDGDPWSEDWQHEQTQAKTVFDEASPKLSFDKRRHSDLKTVRRVDVPEPREETINGHPVEVIFANINTRITNAFNAYVKENCDKNGYLKKKNLNEQQADGLKTLKEKVKKNEIYITQSDKTRKLVGNSRENYEARMNQNIAEDRVITWEEKNTRERMLNGHALQMGRFLMVDQAHPNQKEKVETALRNKECVVPNMRGQDKEHKEGFDPDIGPPLRGIVTADEAPNTQISSHISVVLKALTSVLDKKYEVLCLSTEEMQFHMNEFNKNDKNDLVNPVVFSTDIEKFYSSFDIPAMTSMVTEELLDSELEVAVDVRELALYIAIVYDRQQLVVMGLGDVTHTRKSNRGTKPGITTAEVLERSHRVVSKFNEPLRTPTSKERKLLLSMALEKLMRVSLENHMYEFNGEIRLQSRGGAMGDSETGDFGDAFLIIWARCLKLQLIRNNLTSYIMQFYKDDGNHIMEAVPLGADGH